MDKKLQINNIPASATNRGAGRKEKKWTGLNGIEKTYL